MSGSVCLYIWVCLSIYCADLHGSLSSQRYVCYIGPLFRSRSTAFSIVYGMMKWYIRHVQSKRYNVLLENIVMPMKSSGLVFVSGRWTPQMLNKAYFGTGTICVRVNINCFSLFVFYKRLQKITPGENEYAQTHSHTRVKKYYAHTHTLWERLEISAHTCIHTHTQIKLSQR